VDTHLRRLEAAKNKQPSLVVSESRSILWGSFMSYSKRTHRVLHVAQRRSDGSCISDYLKRTQLKTFHCGTLINVDHKSSWLLKKKDTKWPFLHVTRPDRQLKK
jgi:hypothetical protein